MNTLTLIIGGGVGFAAASCLFFFVIAAAARGSKQQQAETRETNKRLVQLLAERNEIDRQIAGHLHTLAMVAVRCADENDWTK